MPPYTVGWTRGDYRTRVELRPPKLPWPIAFYFALVVNERGEAHYVPEGSEDGAIAPDVDADRTMEAAEHYQRHRGDYQRMALYLCSPTPENRRRAAEVYASRILGGRRLRRTEADRLRVRDTYRATRERLGRVHGAIQETADELPMNRKAVRRALEDCVRHGEMERSELPPSRKRQ
jgi:hypothetical protein